MYSIIVICGLFFLFFFLVISISYNIINFVTMKSKQKTEHHMNSLLIKCKNFTAIMGSSNSGKTSYFLSIKSNKHENNKMYTLNKSTLANHIDIKVIITVVPLIEITPPSYVNEHIFEEFLLTNNTVFINLNDLDSIFSAKKKLLLLQHQTKPHAHILIDEIHGFNCKTIKLCEDLIENLKTKYILEIYVSILLQSYNNNILPNVIEVLKKCNNLIVIPAKCEFCKSPTIQSGLCEKMNSHYIKMAKNNVVIGKHLFCPTCFNCKIK